MDSFIWLLAQTEAKGKAAQKTSITCRQSPVPSEHRATGGEVARTHRESQERLPLSLAFISRQCIVNNVK